MMVQSNFEVNVSRLFKKPLDREARYHHYCKIELGSLRVEDAKNRVRELKSFFPEDFKLDLMYVECCGQPLNYEEDEKEV